MFFFPIEKCLKTLESVVENWAGENHPSFYLILFQVLYQRLYLEKPEHLFGQIYNSAVRQLINTKKIDCITPASAILNWLPVQSKRPKLHSLHRLIHKQRSAGEGQKTRKHKSFWALASGSVEHTTSQLNFLNLDKKQISSHFLLYLTVLHFSIYLFKSPKMSNRPFNWF